MREGCPSEEIFYNRLWFLFIVLLDTVHASEDAIGVDNMLSE